MHYHVEIVIPKTPREKIAEVITRVMAPFDENGDGDGPKFWDFWCLGGRFSGSKELASYDQEQIDAFYAWLREEGVTVSGVTCGKQELEPHSQQEKVDSKWNDMFPCPLGTADPCPLFRHSNDPYNEDVDGLLSGDILLLDEIPPQMKCSRVIFTGPGWDGERNSHSGPLEAVFMLCDSAWNGVNHMPVAWDGTIPDAMRQWAEARKGYRDEYAELVSPTSDWLAVTVDCHS